MQKKAMVDVDLKSSWRFSYSVHPQTDWVCQETGHCHFKNLVKKKNVSPHFCSMTLFLPSLVDFGVNIDPYRFCP